MTIVLKKFLLLLGLLYRKYVNLFNKNGWITFCYSHFLKKEFKKLILKEHYDVVYINYVYYSFLLDVIPAKKRKEMCIVIDTHDFVTINEFQKSNRGFPGFMKMLRWELLSLNRYDKIINISSFENHFFSNCFPEKCAELPLAFQQTFNSLDGIEKIYDLIFVGSDNPFNIRSLQWFLDEIYPGFQHLKLAIVGNVADHVESHFANVIKMGFVQDLTRVYKQSKVAICPMIGGTGLKVKIVEALSYGLPVIASDVVRMGLSGRYEGAIYLARDKHEFDECLYNIEEIKRKTDQAQKYFLSTYSKKSFHEKMKKVFDNIEKQGLRGSLQ
jgi:glycosyltransferase involved in cell wall biosynthesis